MNKISLVFLLLLIYSISYGQVNWKDKIRIAANIETKAKQIEALTEICNSIPQDSFLVTGYASYLLAYRYHTFFKTKTDSILKYAQIGINAYKKKSYKGYRLSRLLEYKGGVLMTKRKEKEAFETLDALDNLELEDTRAIGSFLMAKVDQARIFRAQGDNEAGIQLLEYAKNQPFFNKAESIDKFRFYFEKSISYGIENSNEYNAKCDSALFLASINTTSDDLWNQNIKLNQQRGKIFTNKKQYNEAIKEFEEIFSRTLNQDTKENPIIAADALTNISHCLILSGNFEKAINRLTASIPVLIAAEISKNQQLKLYDNLLSSYIRMNQTNNIKKIINTVDLLINNNQENQLLSPIDIAIYQFDKAEFYYNEYLRKGNRTDAIKALDACRKMDEATIKYENKILTKRAQLFAKKRIDTLYKLPIEIAGNLKNQEAFFYFTERSKNNLLLQDLGNNQYDLKPELDLLQEIRKKEVNNKKLNDKLVNIRKEKLNYLFLENKRTHIEIPDLSKFIEKLKGRFCLNYSFGSSNLYLQAIDTHGKSHIFNLGKSLTENAFESFYQNVSSDLGKEYLEAGNSFIEHLESIQIDTSSILILPDDHLFLFPFDLVKTKKGLLHILDHSYELNASLFTNRKNNEPKQTIKNSVFVSPSYKSETKNSSFQSNSAEFYELPYSYSEVDGLTSFIGKNINKTVNKDKLQSVYNTADLFHFSGHAILDDNELFSYLPLDAKGSNLYAYEFNNWNTYAQMVVLSACETGSGKIAAGEGVLSFSRSIIKSGAKSVISTLWPVNDQSTTTIISKFYSYLYAGESKSEALSKAKQDFLSSCPDYQKHPHYWAGIIITGDNSPVMFASGSKTKWLWSALILSFLLVLIILFLRKNNIFFNYLIINDLHSINSTY